METKDFKFIQPFSAILAGPSQAGKTHFVMQLLKNCEKLFEPTPTRFIYCYTLWQDKFEDMKSSFTNCAIQPDIIFRQGVFPIDDIDPNYRNIVVLDDLMTESGKNEEVLDMFTKGSHHLNFSVILLTQNIFNKGPNTRTISLNAHYIIMFKNPRDRSQISFLARQMYPKKSKFLEDAYDDATQNPHSYLIMDLKQSTHEDLRVQTAIFPGEKRYAYLPLE